MALASKASGTVTADGSEQTLSTQTDAGVYVLCTDLNAMVAGDTVTLRIKTKDKSGGVSRLAYEKLYSSAQVFLHVYSIPVPVDTEIVCTLQEGGGSLSDYDWNLMVI